jgi:hypothetical protein
MAKNTEKDKRMAADLKARKVERVTGRCAQCYRIISIESNQSRYTHKCKG